MLVQMWKNTLRIGPGAVLFVLTEFPGEILWDSAWHGPFQCVKIRKSKGKNGFAVLPEKNISLFHTWILLKHHMNHQNHQMTTEFSDFSGTFLLLPSSGAGGWRQRNCRCTSWPFDGVEEADHGHRKKIPRTKKARPKMENALENAKKCIDIYQSTQYIYTYII